MLPWSNRSRLSRSRTGKRNAAQLLTELIDHADYRRTGERRPVRFGGIDGHKIPDHPTHSKTDTVHAIAARRVLRTTKRLGKQMLLVPKLDRARIVNATTLP